MVALEGEGAINKLPQIIKSSVRSIAETLQANIRKIFIYERPNNPAYYDKLSEILQKLIDDVKQEKITYKEHIGKLIELIRKHRNKTHFEYPDSMSTDAMKVLYDNLNNNEDLTVNVHNAIITHAMDGWKDGIQQPQKIKGVRRAIAKAMQLDENASEVTAILNIAKTQKEY